MKENDTLEDIVCFLAKALKEPEELIYQLRDLDIFEASASNRAARQRLTRKGILIKPDDSDKRGQYIVNPIVKDFLNMYEK